MYYSDFPYYQNYYQFYNYIPKYGYNTAFSHQATSSPSCQVGLTKPSQRKSKENTGMLGINNNQGQMLSSNASSSNFSSNSLAFDRQDNKESELYKQQIVQWLKSLGIDQLFEVFMIKDKWFAQTIIKMFWKQKTGGDSAFALYSEEDKKDRNTNKIVELDQQFYCRKCVDHDSVSNAPRKEAEQEIVRALRIIDDKEMYDSLVFDKTFLENIDHLIEVFDIISDNNIFQSAHFSQWSWFNQNSFQTIASWIVSQFERMVQFKFLEDRQRFYQKQGKQGYGLINSMSSSSQMNNQGSNSQKENKSQNFSEQPNDSNNVKLQQNTGINGQACNSTTDSNNSDSSTGNPYSVNTNTSLSNPQTINQQSNNSHNNLSNLGYENNNSSQENLNHYQNLVAYWRSINSSKKRKILNKGQEMHKILSTNCLIEGLEKNDKQLEWYKKKRDQFYQKLKIPNDEEIQQYFLVYLDENKAEKFIDQLCFTSLEETTSIITIVLKKMHEKLNEMYSEQIAQYLIHNDELEKNFKKKKNNAQNSGNQNAAKKKKKNVKKQKINSNGGINNTNTIAPIKEPSFAEEVSLMHQQQLLQEQQENLKQQQNQLQITIQEKSSNVKLENDENTENCEETSSSLENSKKFEQNKNNVVNNKKKTNGNMPLVLKIQQQQKKSEFLEECCQQNKCEMLELTKGIAQKLINSCIQGVDQLNDTNNEANTVNQKCYETDLSFTTISKTSNLGNIQSEQQITQNTQQSVLTKKKKKVKNGNTPVTNVSTSNQTQISSKNKSKKSKDKICENHEEKTDYIQNDDEENEDTKNNLGFKSMNSPLKQNDDEEDTEELPLQNYTDSDRDGVKKGSEIHSDYTTIDYTGDQYGMRSGITISSSSKCKQNDSHNNSNSSSRHTTKNTNTFSDEEDYKQFKNEIKTQNGTSNTASKKIPQQQINNKQSNKFINIQQKPENNQKFKDSSNAIKTADKNKKNIQANKGDNLKSRGYDEKDTFSQRTSQCTETICNTSLEKISIVSSRNGSQSKIESINSFSNQNRSEPPVDDSDFIQVGCRKKNNKTGQIQNQSGAKNDNRRNINKNNNNNNNQTSNGQNDRRNKNNNNEQNNNKTGNRRGNRAQNDSQIIQSDSRQNNHQNSNRNNRNPNQNEIQNVLTKTKSTIQQNYSEKSNLGQEQFSQSTSTQSRYTQISQASNQKDENKPDSIQISSIGQKKPQTQQSSVQIQTTQQKKINNKIQQKNVVAINTIDILTTKEEEIVDIKPQVQDSQNIEPALPSTKSQQIQSKQISEINSKPSNEQAEINKNEGQKLNKDQKQVQQINSNSTSTQQVNQNQGDTINQTSENNVYNQQTQQNQKQCKMTPIKKQKQQQALQKSPLNLNSEKFAVREEYVQKNYLIQQNSQSNNIPEVQVAASSAKENNSTSQNNCPSQNQPNTTQASQNVSSKKNQQVNTRKKSTNQNLNSSINTTTSESYVATNSSRKGGNNNFQNQWKDASETTYPATNSFNQAHTSKNKTKIAKRLFRKKITNDIVSFTEMINDESFKHQNSRCLIFYRIQHLLKKQFEKIESQVDLRIFGSCATGLSLPTSDIDLGITGFECHPRSDLICVLSALANILEQFKWVKSVERIFTASIPIIKMEVDPFIDFKDSIKSEELNIFFDPNEITQLNMPITPENRNLQGIKLKVDITVECQMQSPNTEILNHMGFLSTDFVVRWMSYYVCLQPMTIVMKCFLHARNLNTNFKGGISSYCLLIMIIAFFRDNQNISQNDDYCNILQSFLKYYGTTFNPETTGISLVNTNPFYPCLRSLSQSKLQVVDPLTSKIMTQNTYLIDEILKEIQGFYNKLNEFSKKFEKQLEKMTYEQIERLDHLDYENQKKELNALFEKNQIESIINDVDNSKTEFYEKVFKQEQLEHNKNTQVYKISDQKQVSTESSTTTTTTTTNTTTTTPTTQAPSSKRSKNYQSKQYNNQQNQGKQNSNRTQQKEQVQ